MVSPLCPLAQELYFCTVGTHYSPVAVKLKRSWLIGSAPVFLCLNVHADTLNVSFSYFLCLGCVFVIKCLNDWL